MPSPCSKKNGTFYKRKGGAWRKTKKGSPKHVGYGKGNLSKRNIKQDKKRKAQYRLKKYQARYSNHSDGKGGI